MDAQPTQDLAADEELNTAEPAETIEESATSEGEEHPHRDTKAEKRINKLTYRAKHAEETVSRLQQEKAELERQLREMQPLDEDADVAAQMEHALAKQQLASDMRQAERQIAATQSEYDAELQREVAQKCAEFAAKVPDYTESTRKLAAMGLDNLTQSVVLIDDVPAVYYALSKDPALAAEINGLPEKQRLVELGKLSAKLTVKPAKTSTAPPPVKAAATSARIPDGTPNQNWSMQEFDAWYEQQRQSGGS